MFYMLKLVLKCGSLELSSASFGAPPKVGFFFGLWLRFVPPVRVLRFMYSVNEPLTVEVIYGRRE